MSGRSTAVQLPEPESCAVTSRAVVWAGGVAVHGSMVCAPGRYTDDLGAVRAQAAAMLAACDLAEAAGRVP